MDPETETVEPKPGPTRELDREARMAAYLARPRPLPRRSTDENGRLLPRTAEEQKEDAERARRSLERIKQMTSEDETDELWSEIYRNIDAERPHRKLFEGMY